VYVLRILSGFYEDLYIVLVTGVEDVAVLDNWLEVKLCFLNDFSDESEFAVFEDDVKELVELAKYFIEHLSL